MIDNNFDKQVRTKVTVQDQIMSQLKNSKIRKITEDMKTVVGRNIRENKYHMNVLPFHDYQTLDEKECWYEASQLQSQKYHYRNGQLGKHVADVQPEKDVVLHDKNFDIDLNNENKIDFDKLMQEIKYVPSEICQHQKEEAKFTKQEKAAHIFLKKKKIVVEPPKKLFSRADIQLQKQFFLHRASSQPKSRQDPYFDNLNVPARRPQKKESAWLADHTTVPELYDKNIEKLYQEESAIQVKS